MDGPKKLRKLLAEPGLLVAPGVFDGLSAHLTAEAGFEAAYVTGAGASVSGLGLPDLGLITQVEMAQHAARIADIIDLPLIADADTGYGNVANVARTVHLYERAGVAALHLEDQGFPKRCGHLPGKELVAPEEFCHKIEAACDARRNDDFVIIARTDARGPLGLDEAIDRANRYGEAGADLLFIETPESREEILRIGREVEGSLLINMVSNSVTPVLSFDELEAAGFDVAMYSIVTLVSALDAMRRALQELRKNRDDRSTQHLPGPHEVFETVGMSAWNDFTERHS